MKRRHFFQLSIAALLLLLGFGGCVSASGGIATSNIPVGQRAYTVIATDEITVSWWSVDLGIIGLPLSSPPVDRAERELLLRHDGDALVNLRYWNDRSVLLLVNRQRFHLKADIIKFSE